MSRLQIWVCSLLFFASLWVITAHAQTVVLTPGSRSVRLMDSIVFSCTVAPQAFAKRVIKLSWHLNGTAIDSLVTANRFGPTVFEKDNMAVANIPSVYKLRFLVLSHDFAGEYRCLAHTANAVELSSIVSLSITRAESAPVRHFADPVFVAAKEGGWFQATCSYYGSTPLLVTLFKNGKWLASGRTHRASETVDGYPKATAVYNVTAATPTDGGDYVCSAENFEGRRSGKLHVQVVASAGTVQLDVSVTTRRNRQQLSVEFQRNGNQYFVPPNTKVRKVSLSCTARRWFPLPQVTMAYDFLLADYRKEKFVSRERLTADKGAGNVNLVVLARRPRNKYPGCFTCTATSNVTTEQATVCLYKGETPTLNVRPTPAIVHPSNSPLLQIAEVDLHQGRVPLKSRLQLTVRSLVTNATAKTADLLTSGAVTLGQSSLQLFRRSSTQYVLVGFPGLDGYRHFIGLYSLSATNAFGNDVYRFSVGLSRAPSSCRKLTARKKKQ